MSNESRDLATDVTLAILAGGAGSRMGMPKGQLTIQGRPILEYLLDQLAWPGRTMLVTAPGREHPPGWQRFDIEVSDPEPDGGPLRGVLTALEHLQTPLLLVLTVDMPGIRMPQCMAVVEHLRTHGDARGVMMRRNVGGKAQIEPFPWAVRADAMTVVVKRINGARRSVHGLLEEQGFLVANVPTEWDERVWANLNSQSDIAAFGLQNTQSNSM